MATKEKIKFFGDVELPNKVEFELKELSDGSLRFSRYFRTKEDSPSELRQEIIKDFPVCKAGGLDSIIKYCKKKVPRGKILWVERSLADYLSLDEDSRREIMAIDEEYNETLLNTMEIMGIL